MSLLKDLVGAASRTLESSVKEALSPLPHYLRKLAGGMVIIALSLIGFGLCFFALSVALFCGLSNLRTFMVSALWTSLVAAVVGSAFLGIGMTVIRRPR